MIADFTRRGWPERPWPTNPNDVPALPTAPTAASAAKAPTGLLVAGWLGALLFPIVGLVIGIILTVRRVYVHGVGQIVLAVVVALAWLGMQSMQGVAAPRAAGSAAVDTDRIEQQIRGQLPGQLTQQGGYTVTLDSIDCVASADNKASCIATVSDATASSVPMSIDVDIDPATGEAIWRTT
jgi:hypothetical protein